MNTLATAIFAFIFVALMALSIGCKIARFDECMKVHPGWYCASQ